MMDEEDIDLKLLFPNLIIFLRPNPKAELFESLNKSFNEFMYGPLFIQEGDTHENGRQISTCRIMQRTGKCLASGKGILPCDAKQQAVEKLFNKLCENFYVIQCNPDYFTKKKFPPVLLNVDPADSEVYRVVFLERNSAGKPFPHNVTGAVDYVKGYQELTQFIEDHAKRNRETDLFILNVLKKDRNMIKKVCEKCGLAVQNLVGCSDMGLHVTHIVSTHKILEGLLKAGGKTIKYKLIGPRSKFGDNDTKVSRDEEKGTSGSGQIVDSSEEAEIVINPWIADRLVIMDVFSEFNQLESAREILFQSVRSCPDTVEFIVEGKRNQVGMILAQAMIDKNVVGRARGFVEKEVKLAAASDALKNLVKCCYYIEGKKSYFGTERELPEFLRRPDPPKATAIYRIADKNSGPPQKILKMFKNDIQEDLFFLQDYSIDEKKDIFNMARKMGFLVRKVGHIFCVYKKRKPKDVLMELMQTYSKQNEKYLLYTPPNKLDRDLESQSSQDWNTNPQSYDSRSNIQPISRDEDSYHRTNKQTGREDSQDWDGHRRSHDTNSESQLINRGNDDFYHRSNQDTGGRAMQDWNDRRISSDMHPEIEPSNRDRGSYSRNSQLSEKNASGNWDDHRTSHDTHSNIQPSNKGDNDFYRRSSQDRERRDTGEDWNERRTSNDLHFNPQTPNRGQNLYRRGNQDFERRSTQGWNDRTTRDSHSEIWSSNRDQDSYRRNNQQSDRYATGDRDDHRTSRDTHSNVQPTNRGDNDFYSRSRQDTERRETDNWNVYKRSHDTNFNPQFPNSDQDFSRRSNEDTGRRETQDQIDHRISRDSHSDTQSINRGDHDSSHRSNQDTGWNASRDWDDHRMSRDTHLNRHLDHDVTQSRPQGRETAVEDNGTPSWVTKYISSAQMCSVRKKPPPYKFSEEMQEPPPYKFSEEIQEPPSPRSTDDVYSRYQFKAPVVSTSSKSFESNDHNRHQNYTNQTGKDDIVGNYNEKFPNQGSKRPYEESSGPKYESEPVNKFSRLSSESYTTQGGSHCEDNTERAFDLESTSGGSSSKIRESEGWARNIRYNASSNRDQFREGRDGSTSKHSNSYGEGSNVETNKSWNDPSKLFDKKPETVQNNSQLWNKNVKQHYDQRPNTSGGRPSLSNLFDYGPQNIAHQGPPSQTFTPKPPHPLNKNRQFNKGHSFSKLAKYGKQRGRFK